VGFWRNLGEFVGIVEPEERDTYPLSMQQYASYFNYANNTYGITGLNQTLTGKHEPIEANFGGFVAEGLKGNSVVFACMAMRLRVLSQARMQFRQIRMGKPGDLFGTAELSILETPWPGGTTGDLLARAELDVSLAGNSFTVRHGDRLRRLRPDWVDIVLTLPEGDPDAETAGYMYYPGGKRSGRAPIPFHVEEVAHFAPTPDPIATFRGMTWLSPIAREIDADTSMTDHRQRFYVNGATPNMVVKFPVDVGREDFNEWRKALRQGTEGAQNAYRTMYLGGGADATVVGANMRQIDFKVTQGAGETRIAAAAGIPPVIVGLSEGLQAATYSNYGQARRSFADTTCAHWWQNFAGSMAQIVNVPPRAELWYDTTHIPFLREDAADIANIENIKANTIRHLIDGGFTADSVVAAVLSEDYSRLVHTGLFSVQLQAPGALKMPVGEVPGQIPVGGVGPPTKPEEIPLGAVKPGAPPKGVGEPIGNGKAPNPAGIGS
jgi:Phage portal protein